VGHAARVSEKYIQGFGGETLNKAHLRSRRRCVDNLS
jgi:hypothetical protein